MFGEKAYAQVCEDKTSEELCLYTDVVYETCNEAKISEFHDSCVYMP